MFLGCVRQQEVMERTHQQGRVSVPWRRNRQFVRICTVTCGPEWSDRKASLTEISLCMSSVTS